MKQRVKKPITPAECRKLRKYMSLRVRFIKTALELSGYRTAPDPATWLERQFKKVNN